MPFKEIRIQIRRIGSQFFSNRMFFFQDVGLWSALFQMVGSESTFFYRRLDLDQHNCICSMVRFGSVFFQNIGSGSLFCLIVGSGSALQPSGFATLEGEVEQSVVYSRVKTVLTAFNLQFSGLVMRLSGTVSYSDSPPLIQIRAGLLIRFYKSWIRILGGKNADPDQRPYNVIENLSKKENVDRDCNIFKLKIKK